MKRGTADAVPFYFWAFIPKDTGEDSMVDQMFPILTTFTEESQGAILARCSDLKFNPDSGAVPLRESFINLGAARDILIDAIEHQKLIQLPITIQSMLLKNLSEISRAQASLLGGTDEVVNLVAATRSSSRR